jgi:hypothetical protein
MTLLGCSGRSANPRTLKLLKVIINILRLAYLMKILSGMKRI